MADTVERVRVIIEADGTARLVDGTRLSAEEMRKLAGSLNTASAELDKTGTSSERTGQKMAGLARDIAQGDWRGAAENMGRMALSSGAAQTAASGLGVALGLGATALVAWGVAMYQAREETERQANVMLLTGNYAGLVSGQLNQAARDVAAGMNGSVGNTRQTMEALVATGRVTTQSLAEMARGVELVSRFSGSSRETVTKDFAQMANGVADWAAKHNQSYNFITFEQYKYIESLEKAGRQQEAMRVTSELLSQHLGGDLNRNMGVIERGWTGIRNAASSAWDAMLNVGREQTTQERIDQISAQLDALQNRRSTGRYSQDQRSELQATLRAQLETAQESARLERRAADDKSRRAQEEQAKIAGDRDKKKDGGNSDFAAGFINRLTTQYANLSGQMSKTEEVTRQLDVSSGKFTATQRAEALNLARLIDERANALRVSQAWTKQLQAQEQLQQAANDAYTSNVVSLSEQSRGYEYQLSLLGRTSVEVERLNAVRQSEEQIRRIQIDLQRQVDSGALTEEEAMQREVALRNLVNQTLRDQIGLLSQVEARRRDMMSGAKTALQDYELSTKRVGDATADMVSSAFRGMEDSLLTFVKTGKINISSFADSVVSDFLRIQIRTGLTGPLAGMLSGLFPGNAAAGGETAVDPYYAPVKHTGGMVGGDGGWSRMVNPRVFQGAPRFHTGGITGDEVPIITKRGEGVFTPGQMKALGGGMGGMSLNISIINNTGSQVSARQRQGSNGMDMEVILDAIDGGMAERIAAGSGQTSRAMESRYGLRTAVG